MTIPPHPADLVSILDAYPLDQVLLALSGIALANDALSRPNPYAIPFLHQALLLTTLVSDLTHPSTSPSTSTPSRTSPTSS